MTTEKTNNGEKDSDEPLKDLASILSKEVSSLKNNDHVVEILSQQLGHEKASQIVDEISKSNKRYYLGMFFFMLINLSLMTALVMILKNAIPMSEIIFYSWWLLLIGFISMAIAGKTMDSLSTVISKYGLFFLYIGGGSALLLAGFLFLQGDWSHIELNRSPGGLAAILFMLIKLIVNIGPNIFGVVFGLIGLMLISGFYAGVRNLRIS